MTWIKHASLTAALFAMAVLVAASPTHAATVLAKDGKARAAIYVGGPIVQAELSAAELRKLTPAEREARDEITARAQAVGDLQHHLNKMTGATFEVRAVDDAKAVKAPAIVFGDLAVELGAAPKHETVTRDAFRLIVKDDMVLFGGEGLIAASHAMYYWLRTLGCNWIMPGPDGEVIPKRGTLAAEAIDVARKPAFLVRSPWYSGGSTIITSDEFAQFNQWKRRMGQTHGWGDIHPDFMHGGHMWASMLHAYKAELEADPTMRSSVRNASGEMVPNNSQLEPMHPRIVELTVDYIRKYFERQGWPKDKHVAMSVGPNDGGGYSESPASLAAGAGRVDPIMGENDQTDVLILYANRVLDAVEEEFPNLKLGFYIYGVHADFPMKHKPHPKFVAHFADITYSRYHALQDRQSYTRNYYRGILEQWARLHKEQGNPLWFYGYNWNLAENLMPYTKVRIWGEDLPYYHKMGVLGHNNEQDKAWSIGGPHNYVMARRGWDVDTDWKDLLKEYCDSAFGAGADAMMKYYLYLDDVQTNSGIESGAFPSVAAMLGREFITKANAFLAEAKAAAKSDMHRRNVDWQGQSVGMLEYFHKLLDATQKADYAAAFKHYEAMMAHWQKYHDANSNLVSSYGYRYVDTWCLRPFLELGKAHSSGDYKVVHRLPDELPTIFDPGNMGALMGLYQPTFIDKDLNKTRTWSTTWDAQGLGPYREGGVWYYDKFKADALKDGEGIGLFVGSVEDEAHVYLNGKFIGKGRGYMKPFVFDLTEHFKPGEDNVIALQVVRRVKLNEAGLGGIIYPCHVFTGPRLEQVAPAVEPMRRILPGGARGEIIE